MYTRFQAPYSLTISYECVCVCMWCVDIVKMSIIFEAVSPFLLPTFVDMKNIFESFHCFIFVEILWFEWVEICRKNVR